MRLLETGCRPRQSPISTTGEKLTPYQDMTHYNNFYEFSTDKEDAGEARRQAFIRCPGRCRSTGW